MRTVSSRQPVGVRRPGAVLSYGLEQSQDEISHQPAAVLPSGVQATQSKTDMRVVPTQTGLVNRKASPAKKPGKPVITIDSQRSRGVAHKPCVLPGELNLDC